MNGEWCEKATVVYFNILPKNLPENNEESKRKLRRFVYQAENRMQNVNNKTRLWIRIWKYLS
jgi:hypothetical protein